MRTLAEIECGEPYEATSPPRPARNLRVIFLGHAVGTSSGGWFMANLMRPPCLAPGWQATQQLPERGASTRAAKADTEQAGERR